MCLTDTEVPLSKMVKGRSVKSEDFMSSNKVLKTVLLHDEVGENYQHVESQNKLKIYLFKPKKIYC